MKVFAPLPLGITAPPPRTLDEHIVALARAASSIAIETIGGRRGAYQLDKIASPEVVDKVKMRAQLVREGLRSNPKLQTSGINPFQLGRAVLKSPAAGVFEVIVLCHEPQRVRVCAVQVTPFRDRYKVSQLEIG